MKLSELVLYGADWCAPCKALKPHFNAASEGYLNTEMGIKFTYVDVDTLDPADLRSAGIISVPTLMLFSDHKPNGVKILSKTRQQIEMEVEYLVTHGN